MTARRSRRAERNTNWNTNAELAPHVTVRGGSGAGSFLRCMQRAQSPVNGYVDGCVWTFAPPTFSMVSVVH